jgi:hypothetical protein
MDDGERGTGNGERGTGNGERGTGVLLREPTSFPSELGMGDGLWMMDNGVLLREPKNLPSERTTCCLFCSELSEYSQVILSFLIAKSFFVTRYSLLVTRYLFRNLFLILAKYFL